MHIDKASRVDLEMAFLENGDLYARLDEARFLSPRGYSDEELREVIRGWILEGDETC